MVSRSSRAGIAKGEAEANAPRPGEGGRIMGYLLALTTDVTCQKGEARGDVRTSFEVR